jgi:hypothetical protein
MKITTLLASCLVGASLFPTVARGDDDEDKAVRAIRKAGGSVGWIYNGPLAGKYHWLICPWEADSEAVMKQVKYLKDLDTVWFWSDGPATRLHTTGDKYLEVLAAIPGLKDLRLEVTNDAAMKHLGTMKNLEKLQLYAKDLSAAGVNQMANLTKLQELLISGIPDEELKHVGRLPKLKKLTIFGKMTNDAGMKHLAGLKDLETLCLWTTAVADSGLKELAGLPALRELRLPYSMVNDEGCKALTGFQELTQLDLSGTKITDAGVKHLAGLNKLEKLWLAQTELGDAGLLELAGGCKSLRQLAITTTKASKKSQQEFRKLRPEVKVFD